MSSKHTPKPWFAETKKGDSSHTYVSSKGDGEYGSEWLQFVRVVTRMSRDDKDSEVGKANLALILKAPDMLEALQSLLAYCRDLAKLQDEYPECVSKAESIVLELTGELPEPDKDGWIEWHGGEDCPVPKGVKGLVRFRGGMISDGHDELYIWWWGRDSEGPDDSEIVAYKVLP